MERDIFTVSAEDYRLSADIRRLARKGKRIVEIAQILKLAPHRVSRIVDEYEIVTPERVGATSIPAHVPPIAGHEAYNGVWGMSDYQKRLTIWERQKEAARRALRGEEA